MDDTAEDMGMKIDAAKVMELVRTVKPLFLDHEQAARIEVKGLAECDTGGFKVQEMIQDLCLYPDIQFMEEKDNRIDFTGLYILTLGTEPPTPIHDYRNRALSLAFCDKLRLNWESFTSPIPMRCSMPSGRRGVVTAGPSM
ncbi:MAG: hypothetical protein ACLUN9_16760 [Enterocloster aldenensis]